MSASAGDRLFVLKEGLYECLKEVGAPRGPLSGKQIMDHLETYIRVRRLYDPKCPKRILCAKDKLGQVFEVENFLVEDVNLPLSKNLLAVPAQLVYAQEVPKRAATPGTSDGEESSDKRSRTDAASPIKVSSTTTRPSTPLVFLVPGTPAYDSGTESELSIQDHETDVVKDSTDDLWFLESDDEASDAEEGAAMMAAMAAHMARLAKADDDCPFEVEYELESHSSGEEDGHSTESDVVNCAPGDIVVCIEEDKGFFADSSDSSHSSDSELGEEDLWECRVCKIQNTPFQSYCQKCWKLRFGWLPYRQEKHPPQKRRRRQRRERRANRGKRHQATPGGSTDEVSSPPSQAQDLSEPSGSSQENCSQQTPREPTSPASGKESSQELRDMLEAGPSGSSQETPTQQVSRTADDLCAMCMVRPRNGIIGHGQTSHRFGCYKCSHKLLTQNKRCPICRRHIDRVYQLFEH